MCPWNIHNMKGCECKNMPEYHWICFRKYERGKGQTGGKNGSSTFVLTAFNFFGWFNILLISVVFAKQWNFIKSQSDAQSSRLIIVVLQVGAVKIYAAAVEALLTPKIGKKTSLILEFSFLVTRLMPYYAKTGLSHPLIARVYGKL